MKPAFLAVLLLAAAWPGHASSEGSTPTQKVLTMMTELKAKGQKMMDEEKKVFGEYSEWVDDETRRLGFEIEDGASKIDELIAFISKADQDAADLGHEIASLGKEIETMEAEKATAANIRGEQHAEYLKISKDYTESVDALTRAIQTMEAEDYDRPSAEAMLQQMSETVPGGARVFAAFLQQETAQRGSSGLRGEQTPAAYENQSGGIISLLESLLDKFKKELADTEEAEAKEAHEFNLKELHLKDTIARDTSDRSDKSALRSKKMAASAKSKGELAEAKKAKAEDEKLQAQIQATFTAKSDAFNANQKVRADELEAISKAAEIISSPEVSGSYAKRVNLEQVKASAPTRTASFLQTGRSTRRMASRQQAAALLKRRAQVLGGSQELATVASALATADGPFAKVIDMVETLLKRLKEEAAAEAEHKAWCDEQLKANKLKRDKKTAKENELSADIEGLTATIADMGKTITKLSDEQTQLTKAMGEATELRTKEKAENEATIADAAAGAAAVKRALVVLKEFYSGQASFLQEQRQVPEMAEYKGMQSGKGGIIGMLEVIQTDFMRLNSETKTAEKAAAAEYKSFMEESGVAKKQKHEAEVKLKLDKDAAEFDKEEAAKDLRANQKELDQAKKYYEELKPNCVEVQVSYEDRVARREEEIQALKEAYGILDKKNIG